MTARRRPRTKKWQPCSLCGAAALADVCPACVENPPELAPAAPTALGQVKRRRPIQSGWCMSERHGRCSHLLQTATDRRPEIHCACRCHHLVRNMTWAKTR